MTSIAQRSPEHLFYRICSIFNYAKAKRRILTSTSSESESQKLFIKTQTLEPGIVP